jgi:hypothetical protein
MIPGVLLIFLARLAFKFFEKMGEVEVGEGVEE